MNNVIFSFFHAKEDLWSQNTDLRENSSSPILANQRTNLFSWPYSFNVRDIPTGMGCDTWEGLLHSWFKWEQRGEKKWNKTVSHVNRFSLPCSLERKKLIRLARVKPRAEQGRALALDHCSGLWKVTASQAAPDSKVTAPWREDMSGRRTQGLTCWLTFGSCVVQKGNGSSWGSGRGTYLRGGHNAGRLPSRRFCGIKPVSEELRVAVGVKVRLSHWCYRELCPRWNAADDNYASYGVQPLNKHQQGGNNQTDEELHQWQEPGELCLLLCLKDA